MESITIDDTPITASRIGLGTWAIGGWMWGGSDEAEAIRTIHAAVDRGITLIDTAPVYGFGESERIVGKALAQAGLRDRVVIATKAGLAWRDGKIYRNSSPRRLRHEVEESLLRLRTDYIDLYQVHWPDHSVPFEVTAAQLGELRKEGKIRAIGVSNYAPAEIEAFRKVARVHTVQPPYNLFERGIEAELLPYARERRITVLAYGALCRGLLTGRIKPATRFMNDDLRRSDPKFLAPRRSQYLAAVDALDRFARENYGKTVLALAVRWILDRGVGVALWGARRPDQLAPVEDTMGWTIDRAAMEAIDRLLAEAVTDPVGPEFMAPPEADAVAPPARGRPEKSNRRPTTLKERL